MIQTFHIENFRGLEHLDFGRRQVPLARVNLIAGTNNVGKTALLEALFLHLGPQNPTLATTINLFRGVDQYEADAKALWGWLFHNKDTARTIHLKSRSVDGVDRTLELRLTDRKSTVVAPSNGSKSASAIPSGTTSAVGAEELRLEYSDSQGRTATARAAPGTSGLQIEFGSVDPWPLAVYSPSRARLGREDSERFSKLEEVGREGEIVQTLRLIEPRLMRLAVLHLAGASTIHGDIGIGRLLPIPYMGDGLGRVLSMALAIASAKGGFVLVDEIENGIHHGAMRDVWRAIGDAARRSNVQVFATTHSWECLRAAHEAFDESQVYDFALHRLDRVDGQVNVTTYDRETLGAALAAGVETR
jgi:hypothetical protein